MAMRFAVKITGLQDFLDFDNRFFLDHHGAQYGLLGLNILWRYTIW